MDRLGAELGFPPGGLLVKRDDLTALAGGGNKARKLERLCADALDADADTLVTGGGRQSNHVRMTAAAANRLGLACTVVLASDRPDTPTGNVVLDELLGPEMVWAGDLDYPALEAAHRRRSRPARGPRSHAVRDADRRRVHHRRARATSTPPTSLPRRCPTSISSSSPTDRAARTPDSSPDSVITARCSASTSARDPISTTRCRRWPLTSQARADLPPPAGTVQVDHDHFGDDYGDPTDACREALLLAARLEGIVLDPVYTGKAMAALVAAARERPDRRVVATRRVHAHRRHARAVLVALRGLGPVGVHMVRHP